MMTMNTMRLLRRWSKSLMRNTQLSLIESSSNEPLMRLMRILGHMDLRDFIKRLNTSLTISRVILKGRKCQCILQGRLRFQGEFCQRLSKESDLTLINLKNLLSINLVH